MIRSKSIIAIAPGATIKEQLCDRELSQKEFALRMEMSEKHISKLINGEVLLTTDMAFRLEMVLGLPASFWLNLENKYREDIKKVEIENNLDVDLELLKKFPYNEIAKLGWTPKTNNNIERVFNLRKFFEVNRLALLFENNNLNILCKTINKKENNSYSLMVLKQKAKLESRKIKTDPINIKKLTKNLNLYKDLALSKTSTPNNKLINELSKVGVSLVFLPKLKGASIKGITFYSGNKIVICLIENAKENDNLSYNLFHELGHIILGHIDKNYSIKMEKEADEFAINYLNIIKNKEDSYKINAI